MRLIDAEALKSYMDECSKESRFRVYYGYAESFINDAPTIDAVPVVRCKDCKHWKFAQHINDNLCHRFDGDPWIPTEPNDFCSYGERQEGADNDT